MENINLRINTDELLREKKHRQALVMAIELIDDNDLIKMFEESHYALSN